jgi:hypothetical protein
MISILKYLTKWTFIAFLLYHLIPIFLVIFDLIGYLNVNNNYIAYVNTPSNSNTNAYIDELNHRGYGEVFPKTGYRPIFIIEQDLNKINRYEENHTRKQFVRLQGVTFSRPLGCIIVLSNTLQSEEYKEVLWHEIEHCFETAHSNNPEDIMYYKQSPMIDINTIDRYLKIHQSNKD